jgi:ammonia channel protein AmtB
MNMVIFALGVVGWFVCGYALMFGAADQHQILGLTPLGRPWHIGDWNMLSHSGFFLTGHAYDVSVMAFFFFQLVFMDATATIPTGAMAERWKFSSFCVWGLFASMLLYPIFGNWVWGGGWLSQLGVLGPKWGHGAVDFAGSGVVHAMGGVAAFWGAKILGPASGSSTRTASRGRYRVTTCRWRSSARSSSSSDGWASTAARPSPAPTSASRWSSPTRSSRRRPAASRRCSSCGGSSASPTRR